jgi:hypothetical protein
MEENADRGDFARDLERAFLHALDSFAAVNDRFHAPYLDLKTIQGTVDMVSVSILCIRLPTKGALHDQIFENFESSGDARVG